MTHLQPNAEHLESLPYGLIADRSNRAAGGCLRAEDAEHLVALLCQMAGKTPGYQHSVGGLCAVSDGRVIRLSLQIATIPLRPNHKEETPS